MLLHSAATSGGLLAYNKNDQLRQLRNRFVSFCMQIFGSTLCAGLQLETNKNKKVPKRNENYFDRIDREFIYERRVANRRNELRSGVPQVTKQSDVRQLNDNQYLLYHRACESKRRSARRSDSPNARAFRAILEAMPTTSAIARSCSVKGVADKGLLERSPAFSRTNSHIIIECGASFSDRWLFRTCH